MQLENISKIQILTQTLSYAGFILESTEPLPEGTLFSFFTRDRFGGRLNYVIAYILTDASEALVAHLKRVAEKERSNPIVIGTCTDISIPSLSYEQFLARFGGGIPSLLPLESKYREHLEKLGYNSLPSVLQGTPSDLYESYVGAGLQLITGRRVIQYGRRRSGERVPDGLALAADTYILFDAKAAGKGFEMDADTMRQFEEYTNDFGNRYRDSLGWPYVFLCISSKFSDSEDILEDRSRQLFSRCRTPICFFTSTCLSDAVELFIASSQLRGTVDWKAIFAKPILTTNHIRNTINAASRDELMEVRYGDF